MKPVIRFDFSTSDFDHAVEVCELAFGFNDEIWKNVKESKNFETLSDFLHSQDVTNQISAIQGA